MVLEYLLDAGHIIGMRVAVSIAHDVFAEAEALAKRMKSSRREIYSRALGEFIGPDGQKSHWLKVHKKMREAAGAQLGDVVLLEIVSVGKAPEPRLPVDLRKALAAAPKARAMWPDLTPTARRDWIQWITSAKRSETRERRIYNACEMLAAGKRRVCCFDRSGFYGKSLGAPKAAD